MAASAVEEEALDEALAAESVVELLELLVELAAELDCP